MNSFKILIAIFLVVFSINVLADINIAKENYNSFETFQAEILFDVKLSKDLSISNIKLFNDNKNIDVSKRLIKVNSSYYYVYFDIPKLDNWVYTFGAYDVYYNDNGVSKKTSLFKNFNINNKTDNLIAINPGFVFNKVNEFDESPFTLVLKNNGLNNAEIEIKSDNNFLSFNDNKFILNSNSRKNVNINTVLYNKNGNLFSGNLIISYSGNEYKIPIIINRIGKNEIVKVNQTIESNKNITKNDFLILGDVYGNAFFNNYSLYSFGNEDFDISLVNNGDVIITNASISVDDKLRNVIVFDKNYFNYIPQYGIISVKLSVKELDKNYNGRIIVKSNEAKDFILPFYIYKEIKNVSNKTEVFENKTILNNEINKTLKIDNKSGNNSLIFWVIGMVILLILFLIYYLHRKNKHKEKEFGDFIEEIKGRR